MFNRHNTRYWSQENQHLVRTNNFQERFGINVWAGIYGHRIVGPILFQGTLSGERYLQFLQNEIWDEVAELPLAQFRNLYFQQDGAPPHNSRIVLNHLTETYGEQVIATHGPVRWPARSPDLTCLDFYLWGYLKDKVYGIPVLTLENLENRIRAAFNTITPEILENVIRETEHRARECIARGGGHFEQYL